MRSLNSALASAPPVPTPDSVIARAESQKATRSVENECPPAHATSRPLPIAGREAAKGPQLQPYVTTCSHSTPTSASNVRSSGIETL